MRKIKLTREEQEIENELVEGKYLDVTKNDFEDIAQSISAKKKNSVLNIRVNKSDIEGIKKIAKKIGIGYQSLISELIHRAAKESVE